jgi:salicylate hydroxylase
MGRGRFVNCVAITHSQSWAAEGWSEPGDHAELSGRFAEAHRDARALIALADPDKLYRWGLFDRPVTPAWHQGYVALLGDAAHPILPFLAFERAWLLRMRWCSTRLLQHGRRSVHSPGSKRRAYPERPQCTPRRAGDGVHHHH